MSSRAWQPVSVLEASLAPLFLQQRSIKIPQVLHFCKSGTVNAHRVLADGGAKNGEPLNKKTNLEPKGLETVQLIQAAVDGSRSRAASGLKTGESSAPAIASRVSTASHHAKGAAGLCA
jgi:hypothetical protein